VFVRPQFTPNFTEYRQPTRINIFKLASICHTHRNYKRREVAVNYRNYLYVERFYCNMFWLRYKKNHYQANKVLQKSYYVPGRRYTYNATLRCIRVTIVAVLHYRLSVCVCSLRYPASNAHAPYCHLWPAQLHTTFPHYIFS